MSTPFVPLHVAFTSGVLGVVGFIGGCIGRSRMDLPGPNTLLGTRTDYSVGPGTTQLGLHGTCWRQAQGLQWRSTRIGSYACP
jgi:hypothetical protein